MTQKVKETWEAICLGTVKKNFSSPRSLQSLCKYGWEKQSTYQKQTFSAFSYMTLGFVLKENLNLVPSSALEGLSNKLLWEKWVDLGIYFFIIWLFGQYI